METPISPTPPSAPQQQFPQPTNGDSRVWRYMDLARALSMLQIEALYFRRADLFPDNHEGTITKPQVEMSALVEKLFKQPGIKDINEATRTVRNCARKAVYINCWHLNEGESEAMWKLYNPNNQGIAIQTSFANLSKWCSTIPNSFIGLVTYFDYKRDQPTTNDFLGPFMHKRKSFAHEAEVRIIQSDFDEEMKSNRAKTLEDLLTIEQRLSSKPSGKLFSFPLDPNIEGVYVNPYAPNWYFDVIRELVKTVKPALANRLQKSDLANPPYF